MKRFLRFISIGVLALAMHTSLGQTVTAKGGIDFGTGNVLKESSGTGAPSSSCTGLARYTQNDAPAGQNIWTCVAGTMTMQGGLSGSTNINTQMFGAAVGEYTQVPRYPLATWIQALNNAANQRVRLAVIGDSFDRCTYTNCGGGGVTNSANMTITEEDALLRGKYGSGGLGMTPVISAEGGFIDLDHWALTGTYVVTNIIGPAQGSTTTNGTIIQMSSGAVATFTPGANNPHDTFRVICVDNSSSHALTLKVDGTSEGTACGTSAGSPTMRLASAAAVSAGTHVDSATCVTGPCYLYAADAELGSTGVIVDDYATGSYAAGAFGSNTTQQLAALSLLPPQGFIYEMLTNEAGQGESQLQFTTYTQNIISYIQGLTPSSPASGIATVVPIDIEVTQGNPLATYTATLLSIVQTNNIALVNEQDRWSPKGCSGGTCYVSGSGLWDSGSNFPGIHPNDKGALDRAQMEFDTLAPTSPTNLALQRLATTNCASLGINYFIQSINTVTGAVTCANGTVALSSLESWQGNAGSGTTFANTGTDSANSAAFANGTWGTTTGFPGSVAQFNGTSTVATATSATNTAFTSGQAFSVCAWFNTPGNNTGDERLVSNINFAVGTFTGWDLILHSSGGSNFVLAAQLIHDFTTNNWVTQTATSNITLNATHQACFTYNGSSTAAGLILYLDGAPAATTAVDSLSGSIASTTPVTIGAGTDSPDIAFFTGALGYVRIWNSVLSPSTISTNFSAGPGN